MGKFLICDNNNAKKLTEKDFAWLSAIIEAEGSISIAVTKRKNGNICVVPFICMTNTDILIINEVKRLFQLVGCQVITHWRKKNYNLGHLPICNLKVSGQKQVLYILPYLIPYIRGSKKILAERVMKYIKLRENEMFTRNSLGRIVRNKYTKEQIELVSTIRTHKMATSLEEMLKANNVA